MTKKGPHISISYDKLTLRVLGIGPEALAHWPKGVVTLVENLAAEMFLARYNPFIEAELVKKSVKERLDEALPTLSAEYAKEISQRVDAYWKSYDDDRELAGEVVRRLKKAIPEKLVSDAPGERIQSATDATDLRMELPMAVVTPETTAQVRDIVLLAKEMGFALIPRGGGTGLTGGAIPASPRTVIVSLSRLKKIIDIDTEKLVLTAQSGVLTLNAIKACDELGTLFTVDPASKAASSLGGNISENSGGPFAFEYGTTLDCILSFTQVMPDGSVITVKRKDHPGHKILADETAVFEIVNEAGQVTDTISLSGLQIRGKDLGKDVSNKFLGGLPGVQKEGVDGIITECSFILYPKPSLSRTLCLEFYGRSMHNAMKLITDVVALRDRIRIEGDLVKISALEEFGPKYVQAINYVKKSSKYEGEPISVLLIQLDSDNAEALEDATGAIVDMAEAYENMDIFAARDDAEAEFFWEDRHKLSAISKRTSGFKINEDIVIPLAEIPSFSDFLEELNLHYLGKAYRTALKAVTDLAGIDPGDPAIEAEFTFAKGLLRGEVGLGEMNDQELEVRIAYFFRELTDRHSELNEEISRIFERLKASRVVVANHMHAGDGNCHVNFPVNSGDAEMLESAHEAAAKVFKKVLSLGGAVSGEHGIGITKIDFLEDDKIEALKAYKAKVDPAGIINPGKLTQKKLAVTPYTFSFNRLINDLEKTALPDKERLTRLLKNIQTCTRCGKCKQACPMYFPEAGFLFHPRNKNIILGAIIEAVYYSLMAEGRADPRQLMRLRELMEHCTACGRCFGACPVKIDSSDVTLHLRAFLEEKHAGGHPIKTRVLNYLAADPGKRVPKAAGFLSLGQKIHGKGIGYVPRVWRKRAEHPLLRSASPDLGATTLADELGLKNTYLLAPEGVEGGRDFPETVFYFPGCGSGIFSTDTSLAVIYLLLAAEVSVLLPDSHLCCGYPLLAHGLEEAYLSNYGHNLAVMRKVLEKARRKGFNVSTAITSCGTCREALSRYGLESLLGAASSHKDAVQFLAERFPGGHATGEVIYHAACHSEFNGVPVKDAPQAYKKSLAGFTGSPVRLSPGCCGESGLGALTSPAIYNRLRERKKKTLEGDLAATGPNIPIVVGCPSCKVGIRRSLIEMEREREVLHTAEFMARTIGGPNWRETLIRAIAAAPDMDGLRLVPELETV